MAFITKGGLIVKSKIKRILALGPGESIAGFINGKMQIQDDILVLGMHHVFPKITKFDNRIDYWTWGDPHAAIEGLAEYKKLKPGERPKIIIPHWMMDLQTFLKHSGTTPLSRSSGSDKEMYRNVLESIKGTNELILIDNALTTKLLPSNHEIFKNPEIRFDRKNTYFNSAPFDNVHSGSNWTSENKFTALILPMCHYLGATEVYSLGFDNKGRGFNPNRTEAAPFGDKFKQKYMLWIDTWKEYHNMKIYNLSPEKYSPNHTFMETVSIDSILKK